jgi:hypothetical protein
MSNVTSAVLHVDYMSAIKLIKNPGLHKRSKHIEVRHFFVREKVADGELTTEHVSSEQQLADLLTKPPPRATFTKLRNRLTSKLIDCCNT